MIPASYLYKDVFFSRWDAPVQPAENVCTPRKPGGQGRLVRAMAAAFGSGPRVAARRS